VAGIDFSKPAQEVYNLVRGCDPQPGAFALLNGEKVRFYGAKRIDETVTEAPGTILDIDDKGIHIALSSGRLVVSKVRPVKGGKVAAAEFATEIGLKAGDKFDT